MDSGFLSAFVRRGGGPGRILRPYYIKTAFQPRFEQDDALRLAGELGVEVTVLELDALADPRVAANPAERCYHCKRHLFSALWQRAAAGRRAHAPAGRHQRLGRRGRPARACRRCGSWRSRSPAGVRPDQRRSAAPVQGGRAVYLGQTRLRLPGHPHPHGDAASQRRTWRGWSGRRTPFPPGLRRFPGARASTVRRAHPAAGRRSWRWRRHGSGRSCEQLRPRFSRRFCWI
ncbi:MAG: hypothetical protein ACLRWQ_16265 [Flavonifractor plautii]